jgi:hypothetical protein
MTNEHCQPIIGQYVSDEQETGFPIWYPLFGTIVIGLAIYVLHRNWGWWRGPDMDQIDLWIPLVMGVLVSAMVFAGAMGLAAVLAAIIRSFAEEESRIGWKGRMVSLRGMDGVSGSISGGIFMMSGHVGSQQFYTYYTAEKDGAFHPRKWKVGSGTRVFEEDRQDGEAIRWDWHFKRRWVYWFAEEPDGVAMDFHIPKGSLKQSFSLE